MIVTLCLQILEDALAVGPCECDVKPKPSDHHTADLSGSCDGASETDKPSPVYASTQTEVGIAFFNFFLLYRQYRSACSQSHSHSLQYLVIHTSYQAYYS